MDRYPGWTGLIIGAMFLAVLWWLSQPAYYTYHGYLVKENPKTGNIEIDFDSGTIDQQQRAEYDPNR